MLGLVDNAKKNAEGTCLECLGIEIDTIAMEARLSRAKLDKAHVLVTTAISSGRLTIIETEHLTGFLASARW